MMLRLLPLVSLLVFQTASGSPDLHADRWREFVIGQTTSEETIRTLGPPTKDKTGKLELKEIIKRAFPAIRDQKGFRRLEYKKRIETFTRVALTFRDDKLVMIELESPGFMWANDVPKTFGSGFEAVEDFETEASIPSAPSADGESGAYLSEYADFYVLIGKADKTMVYAFVANEDGARLRRTYKLTKTGKLAGVVGIIQIISKDLK